MNQEFNRVRREVITYRPDSNFLLRHKMRNLSDFEKRLLLRELETGRAWGEWPSPRG